MQYIVAHLHHEAGEGGYIGRCKELGLLVGSRTEVYAFLHKLLRSLIPLELTAPETAEVAIDLAVIVLEHAGVDRERTTDGVLLRNKRTLGPVGDGYTKMEYTVIVLSREDQVVLAVFLDDIIVPHQLLGPSDLIYIENLTIICHLAVFHVFHGNHVIVLHLEVTAIIIEGSTSLPVMRRIDEQFSVKNIGRRICIIITRIKITRFHIVLYLEVIIILFIKTATGLQFGLHVLIIFLCYRIEI